MSTQPFRLQEYVDSNDFKQHIIRKNTFIARPGDTPTCMIFVVSGKIRQFNTRENGTEVTLNVYGPGALLALPWMLYNTPNAYFFQSIEETSIKEIPIPTAHNWFKSDPGLSYQTLARLVRGFDGVYMRLLSHSSNDARDRVWTELIIESQRFGEARPEGIAVTIKSVQLANRTGLARETASRALGILQDEGLLTKIPDGYVVHKP